MLLPFLPGADLSEALAEWLLLFPLLLFPHVQPTRRRKTPLWLRQHTHVQPMVRGSLRSNFYPFLFAAVITALRVATSAK